MLNLLKKFFRSLFGGEPKTLVDETKEIETSLSEKLEYPKLPEPQKERDIREEYTSQGFMVELHSIEMMNKEMEKAREELLVELKRLAPPPSRPPIH